MNERLGKMKKRLGIILVVAMMLNLFAGCSLFINPQQSYKQYGAEIAALTAYGYDLQASVTVDSDALQSMIPEDEDYVEDESEIDVSYGTVGVSLSADGVYNEPSKQLQAHLGATIDYGELSVSTSNLADIVINGDDAYLNMESIYKTMMQVSGETGSEWPLEQSYYKIDLGEITDKSIWSELTAARNEETPKFVTNIDTFLWDYIKNHGSMESNSKNGVSTAIIKVENADLAEFFEAFINVIKENRSDIADYMEKKLESAGSEDIDYSEYIESIRTFGDTADFQESLDELKEVLSSNNTKVTIVNSLGREKAGKGVYKYSQSTDMSMTISNGGAAKEVLSINYKINIDPTAQLNVNIPSDSSIIPDEESETLLGGLLMGMIGLGDDSDWDGSDWDDSDWDDSDWDDSDWDDSDWDDSDWDDSDWDDSDTEDSGEVTFGEQKEATSYSYIKDDKGNKLFVVIKNKDDLKNIEILGDEFSSDIWNYHHQVTTLATVNDNYDMIYINHTIIEYNDNYWRTLDDNAAREDAENTREYEESNRDASDISEVGHVGDYYYVKYISHYDNYMEACLEMFKVADDRTTETIFATSDVGFEPLDELIDYIATSAE